MPVSSPIGIYWLPDAITFSINVDPHLGTPTINIGLIEKFFFQYFYNIPLS